MSHFQGESMLPNVYPEHFKQQMVPKSNSSSTSNKEERAPYSFDDSSSSIESLPFSPQLQGDAGEPLLQIAGLPQLFQMENLNDFYHLHPQHIAYLAEILNIDFEYFNNLVKLLSRTDPNLMPNLDAIKKSCQTFDSADTNDAKTLIRGEGDNDDSDEVIGSSQNIFN